MKKLLLALALLFAPSVAWAQCNGVFPANYACGTTSISAGVPHAVPASSFTLQLIPGVTVVLPSTPNGILFDNNGVLGDSTTITSTIIVNATITSPAISGGVISLSTIQSPFIITGILSQSAIQSPSIVNGIITSPFIVTGTVSGATVVGATITSPSITTGTLSSPTITGTATLPDGSTWNSTNLTLNPAGSLTNPTLAFKNCGTNCGWFAPGAQNIALGVNGTEVLLFDQATLGTSAFGFLTLVNLNSNAIVNASNLQAGASTSYILLNQGASSTLPTFAPNRAAATAGIGADVAGDISLIVSRSAAGFEAARFSSQFFTLNMSIQFQNATTGASTQTFTNSPCSALTTERWIPVKIGGQPTTSVFFVPACS